MTNSISDRFERIFIFILISNIALSSYIFISGDAFNILSPFYGGNTTKNQYTETPIVIIDVFDDIIKLTPKLNGPLPNIPHYLEEHARKTQKIDYLKKTNEKRKMVIKPQDTDTSKPLTPQILNIRTVDY